MSKLKRNKSPRVTVTKNMLKESGETSYLIFGVELSLQILLQDEFLDFASL